MSTHNICFCGELRKILCRYPLLYGAMTSFFFSRETEENLPEKPPREAELFIFDNCSKGLGKDCVIQVYPTVFTC